MLTPIQAKTLNKRDGVNYRPDGIKETYYNLNMSRIIKKAKSKGIEGEYWIRDDGVKMYGDKVICAVPFDTWDYGTCLTTSLGIGIALDTGAFAQTNKNQIDVAVDW